MHNTTFYVMAFVWHRSSKSTTHTQSQTLDMLEPFWVQAQIPTGMQSTKDHCYRAFCSSPKRHPHCTPQFAHLTANITTRLHCRCNLAIGRFDFNGPAQFRVHLAVCAGNSRRTGSLSFLWRKRCRSSTTNSCKRATGWVWLSIKWIDRIAGQRSCTRTDIFWRARSCTKSRFSNKFLL